MDDHIRDLLNLSKEYYRRGDFDKARPLLEEIANQNLPFADVYNMLGVIHHANGEFGRSQTVFQKALQINPSYTEASLNLAVLFNDIGNYDEAKKVYNDALLQSRREGGEMDPYVKGKIANMYAEIGDAYRSAGFLKEAVEEYKRALDLRPLFVDIRTKLASTIRDQGDLDTAIVELRRTLRDNPKFIVAKNLLGVCMYMQQNIGEALEQWNAVLQQEPNNQVAAMYIKMVQSDATT